MWRPVTWEQLNHRAGDLGGVRCLGRPLIHTPHWAPLSFVPARSTRSTPIGRQQPAAQPATSTSVLIWSGGRMTRSEPSGPLASPPASVSMSDDDGSPPDFAGAEVAPEEVVLVPWFVFVLIGLFVGVCFGVLIGAILSAAGEGAARYDS